MAQTVLGKTTNHQYSIIHANSELTSFMYGNTGTVVGNPEKTTSEKCLRFRGLNACGFMDVHCLNNYCRGSTNSISYVTVWNSIIYVITILCMSLSLALSNHRLFSLYSCIRLFGTPTQFLFPLFLLFMKMVQLNDKKARSLHQLVKKALLVHCR